MWGVSAPKIGGGAVRKCGPVIVQKLMAGLSRNSMGKNQVDGSFWTENAGVFLPSWAGAYGPKNIMHKTPEIQMVESMSGGVFRPKRRLFREWKRCPGQALIRAVES